MDNFIQLAEEVTIHKIRSAWHEIARVYNEVAARYGLTLSMGFVLLTLYEEEGTPVTKIAPRTEHGKQMRKIALKAVYQLHDAIVTDIPQEKVDAFFEVINQVSSSVEKLIKNHPRTSTCLTNG